MGVSVLCDIGPRPIFMAQRKVVRIYNLSKNNARTEVKDIVSHVRLLNIVSSQTFKSVSIYFYLFISISYAFSQFLYI